MNQPLVEQLPAAMLRPSHLLRTLLRHRWFPRDDRALVFLADNGAGRAEPPRGTGPWFHPRPALSAVLRREFTCVCRVSLAERAAWVDVPTGTSAVPQFSRYGVGWRVSDPAGVVRSQVTEEYVPRWIAQHIGDHGTAPDGPGRDGQAPPWSGAAPGGPYGHEHMIDGAGIAYWFTGTAPGPMSDSATGTALPLPSVWGDAHREAFRFYRDIIGGGPVGLAALWLMSRPDQAKDVLDWTVTHRDLLSDRDGWERSLASALQGLTEGDRGFVGAQLAHVLRDIGVPQGQETLDRMQAGADPDGAHRMNGMNGTHRESR
ncbi:hypothetical protein [Streptomyces sp. bgisy100]|uniref:hypothetical protein n=1 Tax=Streptomyces sp. bgisy100 TaxID=3413783 RepID=UPI003D7535F9